jgi:hypothetical protein
MHDLIPHAQAEEQALRRVLYGLYAIIKLHLAKEEEIYLPILEAHLHAEEVDRMVEAMERTVIEVKKQLEGDSHGQVAGYFLHRQSDILERHPRNVFKRTLADPACDGRLGPLMKSTTRSSQSATQGG